MIYGNERVQKYIGQWCRLFRIRQGLTLVDVVGWDRHKALSAFEMGRSSNMLFLMEYLVLVQKYEPDAVNELLEGVERIAKEESDNWKKLNGEYVERVD